MQRLVEECLVRKHPHTASPTLRTLVEALNSQIVGLRALSTKIRKGLSQSDPIPRCIVEIASLSSEGDIVSCRKMKV